MTCLLPAGSGSPVDVRLVEADGATSNALGFSYEAAPPAVPGLGAIGAALLVSLLGALGRRHSDGLQAAGR